MEWPKRNYRKYKVLDFSPSKTNTTTYHPYLKENSWQSPALCTDEGICHGICLRGQLHYLDITPGFFFLIFHLLFEELALLFAFGTVFG